MSVATPPRATKLGTPCAGNWNKKWVRRVQRREIELDRRICGARTADGTPCLLPSDHASGRCPNHGGFPNTGAPEGNRNAVVHGLYSRRIADCGIDGSLELEEYLTITAAVEHRTNAHGDNPLGQHLAHSIALVTVMLNRAARAMLNRSLTDKVEHSGDTFHMSTEKISASLTAFQILAREQRQWMRHLEHTYPYLPPQPGDWSEQKSTQETSIDHSAGVSPAHDAPTHEMGLQPTPDAPGGSRSRATAAHTDDDCYDDIDEEWDELQRDIAEYDAAWEKRRHLVETPSAPNQQAPKRSMGGPPMKPAQTVPASRANTKGGSGVPPLHAHPQPGASPSRDLDRLRAQFIATLKEIQAKQPSMDPKSGPAP